MPGNRKEAFNTMLLHLRLTCITFTVGQLITFSVKLYNIYGGVSYDIQGWFLSHLRLALHLQLVLQLALLSHLAVKHLLLSRRSQSSSPFDWKQLSGNMSPTEVIR